MNKLIIFDLDGTLVDTLDDLMIAVNYALTKFSFPIKSREEIRKAIGNGTIKLIERSAPIGTDEFTLKELHKIFKKYYIENIGEKTKPYHGITSMLLNLKSKGYQLAVVSNKDHEPTIQIISKFFPNIFDKIQGSYMEHPKKPHPYLIEKVLTELNIKKSDITYIGDTNIDEESAVNAGVDYFLVSYGYRTEEELSYQVTTKKILKNVKDIEAIF